MSNRIGLVASVCLVSRFAPPGKAEIVIGWQTDKPRSLDGLFVHVAVEERPTPGVAGKVLATAVEALSDDVRVQLDEVPHGEARVIVVEIRDGRDRSASNVRYFGLSEPFSFLRGVDLDVEVYVPIRAVPSVPEDDPPPTSKGLIVAGAVAGRVSSPRVTLRVTSSDAHTIIIARDPIFTVGVLTATASAHARAAEPSGGRPQYDVPYDLDSGVECSDARCEDGARSVFAKVLNAQGYASRTLTARVVLDRAAPRVLAAAVSPAAVRLGANAFLTVNTDEAIAPKGAANTMTWAPRNPGFVDAPSGSALSPTFELRVDDGVAEGRYTLTGLRLTDDLGNAKTWTSTAWATLDVDSTVPVVSAVGKSAERVGETDTLEVTFRVSEDVLASGGLVRATVGGQGMSCRRSGTAPGIEFVCSYLVGSDPRIAALRASEMIQPIVITALDAAGNLGTAEDSVTYDLLRPRLEDLQVAPSSARASDTVRLSIVASEPLAAEPTLDWAPSTPPLSGPVRTGLRYEYTLPPGTLAPGSHAFELTSVRLVDRARNSTTAVGAPLTSFRIDSTVPSVTAARACTSALRGGACDDRIDETGVVTIYFDVSEPARAGRPAAGQSGIEVMLGTIGPLETCAPVDGAGRSFECTYAMTGGEIMADTERAQVVSVLAADDAGNAGSGRTTVVFDFRDPALTGPVRRALVPRAGAVVREVSRAGHGARVELQLTVDEPLRRAPTVRTAAGDRWPFECTGSIATFNCDLEIDEMVHDDVPYAVEAILEDLAGNTATVSLPAAEFEVDFERPDPPDMAEGVTTLHRAPWGTDASAGIPELGVRGAPGAVGAQQWVIAYDREAQASALELGRARADGGGAFDLVLAGADRQHVFLVAVDGAGNVSDSSTHAATQAELVREVLWTGTLIGRRRGDPQSNPHSAEVTPVVSPALEQSAGVEASQAGLDALSGRDQARLTATSTPAWQERTPGPSPPDSRELASAYDSARGRVVVFDGESGETWEWDGVRWHDLSPSSGSPPRRGGHAMAYDAGCGCSVLFGGVGALFLHLQDTWAWDGARWLEVTPASGSPPARDDHAMVYDSGRGRIVLFGGGRTAQDTWEWDGERWHDVTPPSGSPSGRGLHAMAYDEPRGRVVLYGGLGLQSVPLDTWEWDGAQWYEAQPVSGGPLRRWLHAMVYDEARGQVVLFGGESGSQSDEQDTWAWDGTSWRDITPSAGSPPGRFDHAMSYDAARRTVLLFGGRVSTPYPSAVSGSRRGRRRGPGMAGSGGRSRQRRAHHRRAGITR